MTTRTASYQRTLRQGAWGDPAAVELSVWDALHAYGVKGTGYTRRWMHPENIGYSKYCQASVQSIGEAQLAVMLGWEYYRVDLANDGGQDGEIVCPESTSGGVIDCDGCGICHGHSRPSKNIMIPVIRGKDGDARCYVNVSWLRALWDGIGTYPQVSPEHFARYLDGQLPLERFKTVELWRGPSRIDGKQIVLLATGASPLEGEQSGNRKTGAMVQTYIMPLDVPPSEAVATGADVSVCGDCELRPIAFKARKESRKAGG